MMDDRIKDAERRRLIHDTEDQAFFMLQFAACFSPFLPCPSLNPTDRRELEWSEKLGNQVFAFNKFSIPYGYE